MQQITAIFIFLFFSFVSACSGGATAKNENLPAAGVQESKIENKTGDELRKRMERIAASAKGRVGAKAVLLETGESVSLNESQPFPMQSVYKLPIAMAVLRLVDAGKIKLDQKIRIDKSDFVSAGQRSPIRDENPNGVEMSVEDLLRYAVSESDGTASDVLFELAGGEAIRAYLDEIKVGEINVLDTEKEFAKDWKIQYRNSASPNGAVELLRAVYEKRGLSEQSNALILKLLTETTTKPNRLKGLLPKNAIVAHKTGSSGSRNGIAAATNDIGIITLPNGKHIAIAVFVSDSSADEAAREKVIAEIAKAAWDKWNE